MPGKAIGLTLGFGFAGQVSRQNPVPVIESKPVASDSDPIPFGKPVILNSDNTFDAATSTVLTAANFAGVAIAEVKQQNTYPPDNASGQYTANEMCDVIQMGVVTVYVAGGNPTAGGAVYVRIQESTEHPEQEIGDFLGSSDGSQTVQLTNCSWNTGIVDANGMAELKIKGINN